MPMFTPLGRPLGPPLGLVRPAPIIMPAYVVIRYKLWGAGGGGGGWGAFSVGGAGAYQSGVLPVKRGTTIKLVVGQGGRRAAPGSATPLPGGWPGGGANGYLSADTNSGTGGGLTALWVDGALKTVAGAGGGGGQVNGPYSGGVGGYPAGQDGYGSPSGFGGTQTAGGAGVLAWPGGPLTGGAGTAKGAGGGAGYYGGSGGGSDATSNGAGGGGSSWAATDVQSVVHQMGSGPSAPATGDPDYVAGIANGGAMYADGGDGLVVMHINDTRWVFTYLGAYQEFTV